LLHEALSAENRLSAFLYWTRLKWNLAVLTTLSTDSVVHLACSVALVLSLVATVLAALRST
jgi:hypothetical protein